MRPSQAAAAVVAVLALSGCSGGGGSKTTGETFATAAPATTTTIALVGGAGQAATTAPPAALTPRPSDLALQAFKTPSGNIGCYVTAELARCDIEQRAFSATPKPADCEGDWGSGAVSVEGARPGNFVCASDTVRDPNAPVLGYGQRTRQGSFVCDSAEVGVTCTNEATGHGFFLSRERYRFF